MSSFWCCAGKGRQAANRIGQGNDTQDREDTEDKEDTGVAEDELVTYQEGNSSEEEAAEGNINNVVIVDIE